MDKRRLGRTDLEVSVLGLGSNNFGGRMEAVQSQRVIHAALDHGVNFIDTADVYGARGGSESILGEALSGRRHEVVLATKFGRAMSDGARVNDGSAAYVPLAVEASLRRLRTDYIDLYYLHWQDPETHADETLLALDKLVRAGKVRHVACSNVSPAYLDEAAAAAASQDVGGYACVQDEYSLLYRQVEDELLPAVERLGLDFVPFYPLASGLLSGKYARGAAPAGSRLSGAAPTAPRFLTDANYDTLDKLTNFAATTGRTMLELAFGWLLAKPFIPSVIAGASTPEQVTANARAATTRLQPDETAWLDAMRSAPG